MSFQSENQILVASIATYDQPPLSSQYLSESCRRHGITLTLLGKGQPYPNHYTKPHLVADYLRDHPEYRYVLAVDFKDTIFCASLREIFNKYLSYGHAIVASAETACWPMTSYRPLFPDTGNSYRFLNAGVIMASTDAWLAAWDLMRGTERLLGGQPPERGECGHHIFSCDQAAWSNLYLNKKADIALDSRCQIFQTPCASDHDIGTANHRFLFEGRRIVNRETGGRPCLIHLAGGLPVIPWAHYVLDPPVAWYWPLIHLIRSQTRSELQDTARLQSLLLDLGLHEPIDDDVPVHLLPYSGKGLGIRRRPSEMAAFLAWLATRPPIGSYVEVGSGSGGAFITTVEFLQRLCPLSLAISVGADKPAVLLDYNRRVHDVHHVHGSGARHGLHAIAEREGHVDLVLIDACQPDSETVADWEYARSCSRYVAIHGIAANAAPAARRLWESIRESHRATREFVDRQLPAETQLGLGVVDLAFS